jgi:cell division protein FtsL
MSLAMEWKGSSPPRGLRRPARESENKTARGDKPPRVVEEPRHGRKIIQGSRKARLVFTCFMAIAAAVCAILIFSVFLHVAVVQNEVKAQEVERLIELEKRKQEQLRVEIAALESPARIEDIAVRIMGMVQSIDAEYVETPAYQAAKIKGREGFSEEEAVVSDAANGGQ